MSKAGWTHGARAKTPEPPPAKLIQKTPDGLIQTEAALLTPEQAFWHAIDLLKAARGQFTEGARLEMPQPYDNLGPQSKAVPSPHAGRSEGEEP